jgi:hypothetical protein
MALQLSEKVLVADAEDDASSHFHITLIIWDAHKGFAITEGGGRIYDPIAGPGYKGALQWRTDTNWPSTGPVIDCDANPNACGVSG